MANQFKKESLQTKMECKKAILEKIDDNIVFVMFVGVKGQTLFIGKSNVL